MIIASFSDRIKNAWSVFRRPEQFSYEPLGMGYGSRPDRLRLTVGNERSIIASVYTRLGIDVASVSIQHVRVDQNGRFLETIDSTLNRCLTLSANTDQTGRAFIQDVAMSLFDEGCVAIVATDTDIDPSNTEAYKILSLRTAKILEWYPYHVRLRLYNERTGQRDEVTLPKSKVAIVENPLYSVMNEPNSTLKRLVHKLNLLDSIDEQSSSGKLDLIIQLPYVIRSEARREQADKRKKDIEMQLSGSKYGIAYTDATEKITQLNRPAENNLMQQIEYLTKELYGQLGFAPSIFDGTADERTMLNYNNRSVEPILTAIVDAIKRTFLTDTSRTQGQSIAYFRDPFKLVPVSELANIADKFTRNEILSSNDIRAIIGYKPDSNPKSDELSNKNIREPEQPAPEQEAPKGEPTDEV